MNYGPSFASEFYYYLVKSQILEKSYIKQDIRILSLGCGFAPDLLALDRYIKENRLRKDYEYHGVDMNRSWEGARYVTPNSRFYVGDVSQKINLSGYDIVIISKLFSTLLKNQLGRQFISIFEYAVSTQLKPNGIVIFNDINHWKMGRDAFHNKVKEHFRFIRQYYCDDPEHTESDWIKIPQDNIAFKIPRIAGYSPLPQVTQNIFFEYRK